MLTALPFFALLFATDASAQAQSASVTGILLNERDEPLVGAVVIAHCGGESWTATTVDGGSFSLPALPPGDCEVETTIPGELTPRHRTIHVDPGQRSIRVVLGNGGQPVSPLRGLTPLQRGASLVVANPSPRPSTLAAPTKMLFHWTANGNFTAGQGNIGFEQPLADRLASMQRFNPRWQTSVVASSSVPGGVTLSAGVMARRGDQMPAFMLPPMSMQASAPVMAGPLSATPTLWDTDVEIGKTFGLGHAKLRIAGDLLNPFNGVSASPAALDEDSIKRTLTSRTFRFTLTLAY
jgi:hypothetical protein